MAIALQEKFSSQNNRLPIAIEIGNRHSREIDDLRPGNINMNHKAVLNWLAGAAKELKSPIRPRDVSALRPQIASLEHTLQTDCRWLLSDLESCYPDDGGVTPEDFLLRAHRNYWEKSYTSFHQAMCTQLRETCEVELP